MPAPEPHIRRGRAVWRAALVVAIAGLILGTAAPTAGQLLPITEPEVEEETTPPEAAEETTTTEAPATTTTTVRSTTTTTVRRTTTTMAEPVDDDVVAEEEEPEVVAETTTTGRDLLVPGDGSDGAQATTTTTIEAREVAADGGLDEEAQIWLIVAGLVAVALLIGAWTVRYWRRTRPIPPEVPSDETTVFPSR